MSEDASSGGFTAVLCWNQDRFGRFDLIEAGYWIKPFRDAGITLVTLNDGPIDWNSFAGRLSYSMKQEGKHEFLRDLSKNVLRGQIESARKGSWIGSVPYGYRLEGKPKDKRLVLGDDAKVKTVKRIFREFVDEGRSLNNIACRLNEARIPSPTGSTWRYDSVKGILGNPVYTGLFRYNTNSRCKYHYFHKGAIVEGARSGKNDKADWILRPDNHPPLVKKRQYDKAQTILAKGKTGRNRYTPEANPYLLSGLLRCGHCGASLWAYKCGENRMYQCGKCKRTTVTEVMALECLIDYIETEFIPPEEQRKLVERAKRRELTPKDLPAGFAKLKRLVIGKTPSKLQPEKIKQEIKRLDTRIDNAKRNLSRSVE